MDYVDPAERLWPSPQQEWLLRACLLRGQPAIDAWEHWRRNTVFDDLDWHSQRLVPLLYRNLADQGVRDPALNSYKGIYRRTWYLNQLNRRPVTALLKQLHALGVRPLLLKGAALIEHYYRDPGLRPMGDFDVLVPEAQAEAVLARLAAWGWQPVDDYVRYHSRDYQNAAGQRIDLHWHALHSCCEAGADDDLWAGAVEADFAGLSVLILQQADLLLNVCEHATLQGWRHGGKAPIWWVADAATILRRSWSPADTQRLLEQTEKRRLFLGLRAALGYLQHLLPELLPERLQAAFNLPGAPVWDMLLPHDGAETASHPLRLWFHPTELDAGELVFLNRGPRPTSGLGNGVAELEHYWLITSQIER